MHVAVFCSLGEKNEGRARVSIWGIGVEDPPNGHEPYDTAQALKHGNFPAHSWTEITKPNAEKNVRGFYIETRCNLRMN